MNDPQSSGYAVARTLDALRHFPGINGFITDGPEWGYEIEPGNRQSMFAPFSEWDEQRAEELGTIPARWPRACTVSRRSSALSSPGA